MLSKLQDQSEEGTSHFILTSLEVRTFQTTSKNAVEAELIIKGVLFIAFIMVQAR